MMMNDEILRHLKSVSLKNMQKIVSDGRRMLAPKDGIKVSDWAEKYRMLPETSMEPGRWRTDRAPHTRSIMDAVNDPRVRQITVWGSSQIGKTELMNNIVGYFMDVDPCAIMIMQPTDAAAKDYSQQKLEPMINDTPVLRDKVAKKKSRSADNSTLRKRYAGGFLLVVSGNSVSSLRGKTIKVTIGDDIDAIPIGFRREGDPILLLIKRTTTYPDHLNINISTCTRDGESRIQTLYGQSNQQKFYVKCPHCRQEILLEEEYLSWEKNYDLMGAVTEHFPETAWYSCQLCGGVINEGQRLEMLRAGRWKAERPGVLTHQGFWLNELSSTLSSMAKVAGAIVDAGDDNEKKEVLYNTVFARVWKKVIGKSTDPLDLMERVEDYIDKDNIVIPDGVLLLTCGVDVQKGSRDKEQRIEVQVYGWGKDEECWLIYRGFIPGNLRKKEETWNRLDEFYERVWKRKDGTELTLVRKFEDSGYETMLVYEHTRGKHSRGVFAIKGANRYGADLLPRKISMVDKGRTPLLVIGTQAAKSEVMGRLNDVKEPGPKYIHFCKAFADRSYFEQLTAEHAVLKREGMYEYYVYEKKDRNGANESLDLLVYNLVAMKHYMYSHTWAGLERSYERMKVQVNNQQEPESETEGRVSRQSAVPKRRPARTGGFVKNW